MSDSNQSPHQFGFSTGALERGDFRQAITWMIDHQVDTVELSALRFDELRPLVESLETLSLDSFAYISFHAPSSFGEDKEQEVLDLLKIVCRRGWNIVTHPDVIYNPERWRCLGEHLLIENMDRRKAVGRTCAELEELFLELPLARLCLDVAHARQLDTTLTLLREIVSRLSDRIAEIHISELDSYCRHQPMSRSAVRDYQFVLGKSARHTPVIVESMLDADRSFLRMDEMKLAQEALAL